MHKLIVFVFNDHVTQFLSIIIIISDRFLNFNNKTFWYLQVNEPTKTIVLNAVDLSINNADVKFEGQAGLTADDISFSTEQETATLTFANTLPIGEGQLNLSFKGNLNDKMKGFYRSKYYTPNGEERYGGVTQL